MTPYGVAFEGLLSISFGAGFFVGVLSTLAAVCVGLCCKRPDEPEDKP